MYRYLKVGQCPFVSVNRQRMLSYQPADEAECQPDAAQEFRKIPGGPGNRGFRILSGDCRMVPQDEH
ncbi:hypothetical protein CLV63_101264 [Murinocardiopsis flavida]|uniref:Uncharacterized protein n=1 Tax=Murinocardiopsis flavida TaxID=645275 RepID=A0A2P8DU89_9ACTN|nr:hypothetical protein CLV63_101264 [Murinocardiopsis flavida]